MISQIELRNAKSHVHSIIKLEPGANALLGSNGAGKTTILQAIGLCIFNSGSPGQMLRKGCKSGELKVTFKAQNGEPFTVARKIGASGISLLDETGTVLAETSADVFTGIKDLLGLPPTTDLAQLWDQLVGVPQGSMTAAFALPAAARRKVFDAVLRLEEYGHAHQAMQPVAALGKQKFGALHDEINRIQGALEDAPARKAELATIHKRIADAQSALTKGQQEIAAVQKSLELLQAKQAAATQLESQLAKLQQNQELLQNSLINAQELLEKSIAAKSWLETNAAPLQEYQAATDWLAANADNVARANNASKAFRDAEATIRIATSKAEDLQSRLGNLEAKLAPPAPHVPDSAKIERKLQEIRDQRLALELQVLAGEEQLREARRTAPKLREFESLEATFKSGPPDAEAAKAVADQKKSAALNLQAQLAALQSQFAALQEIGNCPLLSVTCPVAPENLGHIKTVQTRAIENALEGAQAEAASAAASAADIEASRKQYQKLEDGRDEFDHLRKVHATATEFSATRSGLQAELEKLIAQSKALESRREEIAKIEAAIATRKELEREHIELQSQLQIALEEKQRQQATLAELTEAANAASKLISEYEKKNQLIVAKQELLIEASRHTAEAEAENSRRDAVEKIASQKRQELASIKELQAKLDNAWTTGDAAKLKELLDQEKALTGSIQAIEANLSAARDQELTAAKLVAADETKKDRLDNLHRELTTTNRTLSTVQLIRNVIRDLGPSIGKRYTEEIARRADNYLQQMIPNRSLSLQWREDYEIQLTDTSGEIRSFKELSGGEQVMASLAIRISLQEALSPVPFAVYDEPTVNLDAEARRNVATVLGDTEAVQWIVVSHDDAFSEDIQNAIRLEKQDEVSEVSY